MQKKNYKSMTVYKASAGSGKTFTLAVRFIELLIEHPEAYRQTLAVTFTNKATEEMKHRIVSQLYGLWKNLPDSKDYMDRICDDLAKDPDFVSLQAGKALSLILHDYNYFNIETIDAFFQKVLRNLAREMNLNANLRVELNDGEIEEKAVDKLIADLNAKDPVLLWIMGYIDENIAEDKSWNVIDSIKSFGKKIFSDEYKQYADELQKKFESDQKFFSRYQTNLRNIITDADEKMKDFAVRFEDTVSAAGYSIEELKKNAVSFFQKLGDGFYIKDKNNKDVWNSSAQAAAEGPKGWVNAKVKPGTDLYCFAENTLVPLINEANVIREDLIKPVLTAKAVIKNLNELRLLSKIKGAVNDLNAEDNVFLLSDTQNMLNQMMIGDDAPFIFEKIGGPLKNIMIDEFQDTSTIQWSNFRTLLLDCISKIGSLNLIVGDVKQSIYRWRNGDWKLLQSELAADKHLTSYGFEETTLSENYRSEGNIIRFNNAFFAQAAQEDATMLANDGNANSSLLTDIYKETLVHQEIPDTKEEKNNGLVDIILLADTREKKTDEEKEEKPRDAMSIVTEQLKTLFKEGAKDESICILGRNNSELTYMAEYLQNEFDDHTFVSDEAFKLDASFAVNIIIAAIRVLNHPKDKLVKAQLAKLYQEKVCGNTISEVYFRQEENIDKFLPRDFVDNKTMLLTKPMTDLAEELFRIFELKKLEGEAAYIMAFYDQLSSFAQNNVPDLEILLETWEESMHKKTVKGGALSGVRLMTIHKSKGLEADHILIPFCGWKLESTYGNDLWCTTKEMPFAEMPVLPVNTKDMKNTYFDEEYRNEQLQICIDNMNMLYVAFTRARKNLFVICRQSGDTSSQYRTAVIKSTLQKIAENLDGAVLEKDADNPRGEMHFTYGKLYIKNKKEKTSENVFLKEPELKLVELIQEDNKLEFRQSNASRKFVEPAEDENTQLRYTSTGTILHSVLARINDVSEIDKVLNEFVQEGRMSDLDPEMNREKMSALIRSRIEDNKKHPEVNRWYSKDVEVFNECTIVGRDEETGVIKEFRPDRVVKDGDTITVIDYKFGQFKNSYTVQVKRYIEFLRQMGYKNVKGCLWFVYTNDIKTV